MLVYSVRGCKRLTESSVYVYESVSFTLCCLKERAQLSLQRIDGSIDEFDEDSRIAE